jgi:DUF4097 and DUF4098 domain-containing protein YvlB
VKVEAKFDPEFKQQNGPSRFRQVGFRVSVPRTYNLDLKTAGGHIVTKGELEGSVRVNSAGGHLEIAKVIGPVWAHTAGGHVKVSDVDGPAKVRTAGGHIELGHVQGDVMAETSGGNIKVDGVDSTIQAKTSGGNIIATITKQPENDCTLNTSAGNIEVHLDKDINLNVEVSTSVGHVRAPFAPAASNKKPTQKLQVKLNDGGPNLSAQTSAGNIVFEYIQDDVRNAERSSEQESSSDRSASQEDRASDSQ